MAEGVIGGAEGRRGGPEGQDSLEVWLRSRSPSPPEPLIRLLLEEKWEGAVTAPVLAEKALAAFRRALETPGRVRSSAFHLLAGDALLTYACELSARAPDVEQALRSLLRRVAEGLEPSSPGGDPPGEATPDRKGP